MVDDGGMDFVRWQVHRSGAIGLFLGGSLRDVVAIPASLPWRRLRRLEGPTVLPIQPTLERESHLAPGRTRHASPARTLPLQVVDLVPKFQIHDRRVLAAMPVAVVVHLADVHAVVEQFV